LPQGEKTEKQKAMDAYLSKYGDASEGGGAGEKPKKKKRKVKRGALGNPYGLKIIDEDVGLGGVALAKAKGAVNFSDEEMSDEQAVVLEEEELLKIEREAEAKRTRVQVGDGGNSGGKWVEIDEDGNVVQGDERQGVSAGQASDLSPPRRSAARDLSPPRRKPVGGTQRRHDSDSDQSPPRRGGREKYPSPARKGLSGEKKVEPQTVNGLRAGYVSGKELTETMERKKRDEEDRFSRLDNTQTGKVAETVYRDKAGKRVEADSGKRKKTAEEEETELKNMVWGKGLVQMEEKEEARRRLEAEKSRPFARTEDDKEMNDELKQVTRWGDPMAARLEKTQSSKPKYRGPYPPNRYGIPPGYRWDGVDRSNGFERNYFNAQNTRRTREHEAHLWSTEQM
jgi:pre-mRNA-splicing factor CWC26